MRERVRQMEEFVRMHDIETVRDIPEAIRRSGYFSAADPIFPQEGDSRISTKKRRKRSKYQMEFGRQLKALKKKHPRTPVSKLMKKAHSRTKRAMKKR